MTSATSSPARRRNPAARWAVGARLARREVRRHPWRHLLVTLLIFVPVLATFGAFSAIATVNHNNRYRHHLANSDADLILLLGSSAKPGADQLPKSQPGIHIEVVQTGSDWLVTNRERADGQGPALVGTQLESMGPTSRRSDRYQIVQGHLPSAPSEIAISAPLAAKAGLAVGNHVASAQSGVTLEVSGIVRFTLDLAEQRTVVSPSVDPKFWSARPGQLLGRPMGPDAGWAQEPIAYGYVWADTPAAQRALDRFRGSPLTGGSPTPNDVAGAVNVGVTTAGAGLAAIVAVVASAAFAIGARRQLRTVGLLSTTGADPAVIRASLVLQGLIPGAAAGLAACLTGGGLAHLANARGWPDQVTHQIGSTVQLSTFGAITAVGIGCLAGILAAWQPARAAARLPVLTALAGRRPLGPLPGRVPMAGFVAVTVGFGLLAISHTVSQRHSDSAGFALIPIVGVLAFALGAVALAPAVVAALGPLARQATGVTRLALRSIVRNRSQSASTVAALAVGLALPIALLSAIPEARNQASRPEDSPMAVQVGPAKSYSVTAYANDDPMTTTSPKLAALERQIAAILGPEASRVVVTKAEEVGNLDVRVAHISSHDANRSLSPWARRQLNAGRAISLSPDPSQNGKIAVHGANGLAVLPVASVGISQYSVVSGVDAEFLVTTESAPVRTTDHLSSVTYLRPGLPGHVVTDKINALGSANFTGPTLKEVRDAVRADAKDGSAAQFGSNSSEPFISLAVQGGPRPRDARTLALLAAVFGGALVALLILSITLTLRSIDGQDDRRTAMAMGAAPHQLGRQRAVEGVVLTSLGAVLALPLGWLPVVAVRLGATSGSNLEESVRLGPGWAAVPVLLAPIVLAGLTWLIVPAVRAATVGRRARDLVLPRT